MLLPKKIRRIHIVGIGGIGMSAIAEILFRMGFQVTGSDLRLSDVTKRLSTLGIHVFEGHREEHVESADLLLYSSAVNLYNPELQKARALGIPAIRRHEILPELMRTKYGIAIAGTHGKSTTTSMIGLVLLEAQLDPTIIVGGNVGYLQGNARLGESPYFVIEADEFDRTFLALHPIIAVITTLEAEHLDSYADLDDIKGAFTEFANKVPFHGKAVLCWDEANIRDIVPRITKPFVTYGLTDEAMFVGSNIHSHELRTEFDVRNHSAFLGHLSLNVPGNHNVKNALAAVAVGVELDIPFETIRQALEKFRGVQRRFEIKGEARGMLIVDDYAHHPTEVRATLEAARRGWPDRRVVAIFQPHLYTRTRDFAEEFGQAFDQADLLILMEIYPARETPIEGVTGRLIVEAAQRSGHPNVHYLPQHEDALTFLSEELRPGDLLITLGAGDVWRVGEALFKSVSD